MDFVKILLQSFLKFNNPEAIRKQSNDFNTGLITQKIEKIEKKVILFFKVSCNLFSNLMTLKELTSN